MRQRGRKSIASLSVVSIDVARKRLSLQRASGVRPRSSSMKSARAWTRSIFVSVTCLSLPRSQ